MPEIEDLISVTKNATAIITDTDDVMQGKSPMYIRSLWRPRLQTAHDDWLRTLEWSSPDFNPEGYNKLSKAAKMTSMTEIQEKFDNISVPFNSNESVYGEISKPLIDSAYGAYTQDDAISPDYTANTDWEQLSEVWDSIPSDNAPLHGVPKIRTDAF